MPFYVKQQTREKSPEKIQASTLVLDYTKMTWPNVMLKQILERTKSITLLKQRFNH